MNKNKINLIPMLVPFFNLKFLFKEKYSVGDEQIQKELIKKAEEKRLRKANKKAKLKLKS